METVANSVITGKSSIVRVYIGIKSKGLITQKVLLLWMSKTLLYESPYNVKGIIKVAGS
jgi:hypothetical protein